MNELFAVISGVISGACLLIIALRAGLPLFGSIVSSEVKKEMDSFDKFLSLVAFVFFIICMLLLVLSYS